MEINLTDPNILPWLIPVGPLLAFALIVLLTNRSKLIPATSPEYGGHHPDYEGMRVFVVTDWSRVASIILGMSGVVAAFLISLAVVSNVANFQHHFGEEVFFSNIEWMATGSTAFRIGVLVDPLTTIMLIMVPIAVLCIFIYSIGYMAHDPRQSRFFAFISLFAGAMLTLVVADNLLLLFVGWEIMGLCSYLLIGFWFEKESAYKAAIKAFTTTRVADVIMLLGIAYLYSMTGTLSFREILYNPEVLEMLATTPAILFGGSAAALIGVFLIIGTIGKSAQFPLHVWLPDAMEGPTPVSAMIHAAAMVSAGIYAIIRMFPLLAAGADVHHGVFNTPLMLMAVVGSVTALFAATIAVAQNDVKRVLAYSTISQLGFMMAALGIGAYIAAAFHLITHAFFKALLFMAAGSVIHGMEHGEHHVHEHAHAHGHADEHEPEPQAAAIGDEAGEMVPAEVTAHVEEPGEHPAQPHVPHFDPQDMMNMGGLRKTMPVTFWTFLIGGLSLSGFPLITAGFWSKDEILADGWLVFTEYGSLMHLVVFLVLAVAAFLTAFYTMRQLGLTFWGEPRTEEAKHASLGQGVVSATMTLPLIILAFFALTAGFVGVPTDFPILGAIFSPQNNPFHHFVIETLPLNDATAAFANVPAYHVEGPPFSLWIPFLTSLLVALGGVYAGYLVYWRKPLAAGEVDPLVKWLGDPLYTTLKNKYYIDELYQVIFIQPSQTIARLIGDWIDRGIIDGILYAIARIFTWIGDLFKVLNLWLIDGVGDGIPTAIGAFGRWFRRVQTGRVQQYMLLIALAAILIGIVFAVSTGLLQAAP
ncbi:MAG: NADH-quinone oxidoreductase subunit L [Anaerolineae bacterium]|nr:NADH-quinone oxidoreductase subunit L [Anaerolineae bacterium]